MCAAGCTSNCARRSWPGDWRPASSFPPAAPWPINWACRALGAEHPADPPRPGHVPVWAPYPRGERVPLHDAHRRGALVDLDLTHDAAAVRRAVFEASGFVTRRMVDAVATIYDDGARTLRPFEVAAV